MIDIKGTDVKMWRNDREANGRAWHDYSISFSGKDKDGNWSNKNIKLKFTSSCGASNDELYENGILVNFSGFPSVEKYTKTVTDVDGNKVKINVIEPVIVVQEIVIPTEWAQADEDLPF